jgi:hypothetical protein
MILQSREKQEEGIAAATLKSSSSLPALMVQIDFLVSLA